MDIAEQVECVERELRMRRQAYPRWVANGKMSQKKMDYEIAAMEAVLRTLLREKEKGRLL